jgi:peroxiredoxin
MAKTTSTMLPLGAKLPRFELRDVVTGQTVSDSDLDGNKGVLVMFICKHCPFVVHVKDELARLGHDYRDREVSMVAISSNDVATYPDDAPEKLAEMSKELGFEFPFLYDESQDVAKAFQAACTPDFFLFDASRELFYRGQLDDSRPGNGAPNDGRDLRVAMDSLIAGEPIDADQKPSIGCNIKWKPGNEPAYFG